MGVAANREGGHRVAAATAAGIAGLLYAATTAPTVTFGGDCGELAAAAHVLGVAHPTGYPLYLLLAKLTSVLLPFGEVAWRVAVLSNLAGAAAVGLVVLLVARCTDDRPAAFGAGAALMLSAAVWSQALLAEVYAVHLAILAGLLLAHAEWWRTGDRRWLNLLGLGYGLGLCHHLSIVLFAPATALFLAVTRRADGPSWPALVARVALWALPPLALLAYLPLRAAAGPALNWGECDTWPGLLAHLTGREYAGNLFAGTPADMARYAGNHLFFLAYDLRYAAALALYGVVAGGRERRPLTGLLVLVALTALGFAAAYRVGDRANYVLPAHLAAAVLAGFGAAALRQRVVAGVTGSPAAHHTLVGFLVVMLPFLPAPPDGGAVARVAFDRVSLAGNTRARDLADAVLDEVAPGAAVACVSDELAFACWYQQVVAGRRRDVEVIALGDVTRPRGGAAAAMLLARESGRRPTYTTYVEPDLAARYWLRAGTATCRLGRPPEWLTAAPTDEAPTLLPGAPRWAVLGVSLDSAVTVPVLGPRERWLLPGVKPWTLARLRITLQAPPGASRPWLVIHLVHDSLLGEGGTRLVNDSSGGIRRQVVLEPQLPAGAPPAGPVSVAVPVTLPERAAPGRYQVRIGLRARQEESAQARRKEDSRELGSATVPVGWLAGYER